MGEKMDNIVEIGHPHSNVTAIREATGLGPPSCRCYRGRKARWTVELSQVDVEQFDRVLKRDRERKKKT